MSFTLVFSYKNGVYKKLRLKFPKISEVIKKLAEAHFQEKFKAEQLCQVFHFESKSVN